MLALGSAIQLLFFYHTVSERQTSDFRLILATFFMKNMVLPLLGFSGSQPIATWLHAALDHGYLPTLVLITISLVVGLLLWLVRRGPAACWWLVLAGGLIALVSYYGALSATSANVEPHASGRYAFVPQVLFAWTLVASTASTKSPRNLIAWGLVVWIGCASVSTYLHPDPSSSTGPDWRAEVAKWRLDSHYSPQVWPGGTWRIPMPIRSI